MKKLEKFKEFKCDGEACHCCHREIFPTVGKRLPTELTTTVTGGLRPSIGIRIKSARTNPSSITILDFLESKYVLLSVRVPYTACIVQYR